MPSLAQFIVWIVMGLLGGSLAGLIMTRERKGFGLARNMGLGLAGAIVGGLLFRLPAASPWPRSDLNLIARRRGRLKQLVGLTDTRVILSCKARRPPHRKMSKQRITAPPP